jgi:uncharacterized coiled-coil protein SlyX
MPSPHLPDVDQRLREVEERLSFQQREIEQLNEVILSHEQHLEALRREARQITESLRQLAEFPGQDLPQEKPPHY